MKLSSKKTIIIVTTGSILLLILGIFLLLPKNQTITTPKDISPTTSVPQQIQSKPTGPPIQTSLISFQQKTSSSSAVVIDSGNKAITAIQLEIGFDPTSIESIRIEPGTFFNNALSLLSRVDYQKGSIFYVLAIPPAGHAKQGSGEVATLYYSFHNGAFNPTIFQFLPKTKVAAQGIDDSTLKAATPITVASSY